MIYIIMPKSRNVVTSQTSVVSVTTRLIDFAFRAFFVFQYIYLHVHKI